MSYRFQAFGADPGGGRFQKDRVRLLTDQAATLGSFRLAFGWLRDNVQAGDLVVLYLSSHGSPPESDPNSVSYVLMSDTKLGNSAELFATSLQMIDLVEQINRELKSRRVVLFLDTCFSGDASKAGRQVISVAPSGPESAYDGSRRVQPLAPPNASSSVAFSGALNNLRVGTGRAVITASRANEVSFEDPNLHNGYFTYFLIQALRSGGASQTLGDLFPHVRDRVLEQVRRDHPGKAQTPSCEFSDRAASITISVPEAAAGAVLNRSQSSSVRTGVQPKLEADATAH